MKRNLLWRGLVILASIVISVLLAYPPRQKINLGLDLRGGMHLVLQVHTEDALRAQTDSDMERLLQQAKDDALELLSRDPSLRAKEHQYLRAALQSQIGDALALAQIG